MRSVFLLVFLAYFPIVQAQNQKTIDSVNAIPFEVKLEKAAQLHTVFLKNVADAQKIGYTLGEAESYSNLSLVYYFQGKYDKDLQYSLKAIELYEQLNETEKLALAYGELGYRMKKRNMQKAEHFMLLGKKISEQKKLNRPLLSIYNNYGVLKEMQEQLDSAMYFYQKGLVLKESIQDSLGIPYSLDNIAGIHLLKGRYQEAQKLYDRALQIRLIINDPVGIVTSYSYLGDLKFAQGDFPTALTYFEKALQLGVQYGYTDVIQHCYQRISKTHEMLGNPTAALQNYQKFTQFKDSLLNQETNTKIAELEIQFETNQKEKLLLEQAMKIKNAQTKFFAVSSVALIIALIGWMIYRQQKMKNVQQHQEFELKSTIAQIETQSKLQEQRLSISRDLHDNIGAQLTFIISTIDNLKYAHAITDSKILNHLNRISEFTKSTIVDLRDTIWAMNAESFTCDDLHARILSFINKAQMAKTEVDFQFDIDPALREMTFSSLVGINLYRTIQESIHNALKYSDAQKIRVDVKKLDHSIQISIQDNGKGFDMETVTFGNGLYNMEKRISDIGGTCNIHSILGKGTDINILLKIDSKTTEAV